MRDSKLSSCYPTGNVPIVLQSKTEKRRKQIGPTHRTQHPKPVRRFPFMVVGLPLSASGWQFVLELAAVQVTPFWVEIAAHPTGLPSWRVDDSLVPDSTLLPERESLNEGSSPLRLVHHVVRQVCLSRTPTAFENIL